VQGRAWGEEIPQASLVSLAFPLPPPSCARRVENNGGSVRVCVTVRVCASELLDCRERLQREGETDQTEGPSVVDQAKETVAPAMDIVKDQTTRTGDDTSAAIEAARESAGSTLDTTMNQAA
jgi:hypothetical protein